MRDEKITIIPETHKSNKYASIDAEGLDAVLEQETLSRHMAEAACEKIVSMIKSGRAADGSSLSRLSSSTIKRRAQRAAQKTMTESLRRRMRGRSIESTTDPLHETGSFLESISVEKESDGYGVAVNLGDSYDSGEGAVGYALDLKYPSALDVPDYDKSIDKVLDGYLDRMFI